MNPIEYMKFESKNIGKFNNLTIKSPEPLPIKLSTFYEAKSKLENYVQAVTLYGIRRTGKTAVMDQLWHEVKTSNSLYILITKEFDVMDLTNLVLNSRFDYVFIDEVTRLHNFQTEIHSLLDIAYGRRTKLVLAGTDSYLISLSRRNAALGRLSLVKFIPVPFSDLQLLNPSIKFLDFYEKGIHVTEENVTEDLVYTVMESLIKAYKFKDNPLYRLDDDYIYGIDKKVYNEAIVSITEYVIGVITRIITPPGYSMGKPRYCIPAESISSKSLSSGLVTSLFDILCEIDIIKNMVRRIVNNGEWRVGAMFYLAVPALYMSYVKEKYDNLSEPGKLKISGITFEATAVTQILAKLDKLDSYETYSMRGHDGSYEIDMCIEKKDYSTDTRTLTLIEFKRSKSKTTNHFYHPDVVEHTGWFEKVNRYIVYAVDNKEFDSSIPRVYIEDFLSNLEEYLN